MMTVIKSTEDLNLTRNMKSYFFESLEAVFSTFRIFNCFLDAIMSATARTVVMFVQRAGYWFSSSLCSKRSHELRSAPPAGLEWHNSTQPAIIFTIFL